MSVCFPGVGLHRSADLALLGAPAERIVVPGGPNQYYAVHQYSVVRRVWGASGVAGFLISAPPTPPQDLIAGILSTHVRCRQQMRFHEVMGEYEGEGRICEELGFGMACIHY